MTGDCPFSWTDAGDHTHFCVYTDDHDGPHVCECGEQEEE